MPEERPSFPARAVVTAGMPYGNKSLHFGHIAGVFVPADFYARFLRDRIGRQNVVFVSGTDCFGSPIMEGYRKKVEGEGYEGSILDYVRTNHDSQKSALDAYEISCDLYAGSGLEPAAPVHARISADVIERLHERGYLRKMSTRQFYDVKAGQFLNGRQVQGHCPVKGCKSEKAYADECDLGHQFDPEELIDPVSQLTGTKPELRPVDNWYFDLPRFQEELEGLCDEWEADPQVRPVVSSTVRESLAKPVIYIQAKYREAFEAVEDELPSHEVAEPQGNQGSLAVTFEGWEDRDKAREALEDAGVRFRAGKTLLPFRITGNISWGVPAPDMDGLTGLTVWCWPESLWAPISFTETVVEGAPEGRYASRDWHDWWCADDAQVFQFIGQDNIYFYCVAQPALWNALDWGLFQDTPVANYHVLFMNKKASSSGSIRPPMADELLSYYTPEQLRAHWLGLALDSKAVSFSPKPLDTSVSHKDKKTGEEVLVKDDPRVVDPVLKEGTFLTNILNRLARSCFYGAQNVCGGRLPVPEPASEAVKACREATLAFERAAHDVDIHGALAVAEAFCRDANKRWDETSKAAKGDDAAYAAALADAFCALRTAALLWHPAVPAGCELICEHLGFDPEAFFSWDHAFEGPRDLARALGEEPDAHELVELPPRFDFFERHPSQAKRKA
ncbi:MAG: class I tRNA ligase family protein [Atopobiaceae bacterium]|jgi:methionyl-tRNA synthetase|nr:class I tRNA ligase family protein [Atopobiaceae bacterium]MCH4119523.1 class I tRNA ligase family protein [Atopobiaceae bacterium]MCI1317917.1 class I tRNA ligase family protein [Atopobiaceae bacterium]MCI1389592.1 class I tRNA ligase family protein [Atopobiaceae bacterium]MCI1431656.1 class I tRNA ligase family protein [Atopobiaceae bacterium]